MIVTLLTDYGHGDEFVGVCHGVVRTIAPEVPIVDVTHGIPRHGIRAGALALRNALPYLPAGVHVAVVDPQVGTERRAVALRCGDGRLLVGPDNGVLSLAWDWAGGVQEAVDVSRSQHRLEPVSATFHGRDVFAPVAAHLAIGSPLAEAGDPLDPRELVALDLPAPTVEDGTATAHVLVVDRFGNAALNLGHRDLLGVGATIGARVVIATGGRSREATVVQTFADVPSGELLLYEDAWGSLALAVNRGDAAAELGLAPDREVRIARAP
ncbi:MAG: SAM-dependent chlorinase/fluorinase [Actinobacteria bacterium]|nr:SAM-dependent chlorinase/fluorinase [Actinomycetota bacterium]